MAGFSYMDKQNSLLLDVSVTLDSIYPPAMNFNVTPFVNGKYNREQQIWTRINPNQFYQLYQNLMDPNTYGMVEIVMNFKTGSITGAVGLQNGVFYVNNGNTCQTLNMDPETVRSLAMYVMEWYQHGGVYKDLFENVRNAVCKSIGVMIEDVLAQMGMPALQNPIKMFKAPDNNGNGNGYRKKNNYGNRGAQQPNLSQTPPPIGGNGQYRAAPPKFSAPAPMPSVSANPTMPIPNMPMPNIQQPNMSAPIPHIPQQQAAQSYSITQQNKQQAAPQMPNIPMGMPIPQTPNSAEGKKSYTADVNNMINNAFGQMPMMPQAPGGQNN